MRRNRFYALTTRLFLMRELEKGALKGVGRMDEWNGHWGR
jgi:hypothetical protein